MRQKTSLEAASCLWQCPVILMTTLRPPKPPDGRVELRLCALQGGKWHAHAQALYYGHPEQRGSSHQSPSFDSPEETRAQANMIAGMLVRRMRDYGIELEVVWLVDATSKAHEWH